MGKIHFGFLQSAFEMKMQSMFLPPFLTLAALPLLAWCECGTNISSWTSLSGTWVGESSESGVTWTQSITTAERRIWLGTSDGIPDPSCNFDQFSVELTVGGFSGSGGHVAILFRVEYMTSPAGNANARNYLYGFQCGQSLYVGTEYYDWYLHDKDWDIDNGCDGNEHTLKVETAGSSNRYNLYYDGALYLGNVAFSRTLTGGSFGLRTLHREAEFINIRIQEILPPSSEPTSSPTILSTAPSVQPSSQPSSEPSSEPSADPSSQPSSDPSKQPSNDPSVQPSNDPTWQPSIEPSDQPTSLSPSWMPSLMPSMDTSITSTSFAFNSPQRTETSKSEEVNGDGSANANNSQNSEDAALIGVLVGLGVLLCVLLLFFYFTKQRQCQKENNAVQMQLSAISKPSSKISPPSNDRRVKENHQDDGERMKSSYDHDQDEELYTAELGGGFATAGGNTEITLQTEGQLKTAKSIDIGGVGFSIPGKNVEGLIQTTGNGILGEAPTETSMENEQERQALNAAMEQYDDNMNYVISNGHTTQGDSGNDIGNDISPGEATSFAGEQGEKK